MKRAASPQTRQRSSRLYPVRRTLKPQHLSGSETSSLLRSALKKAFPEVPFLITAKSNHKQIYIRWTNGPSTRDVQRVAKAYVDLFRRKSMSIYDYIVPTWLLPDGSTERATASSGRITEYGARHPRPHTDPRARLVRFDVEFIACKRNYTPRRHDAVVKDFMRSLGAKSSGAWLQFSGNLCGEDFHASTNALELAAMALERTSLPPRKYLSAKKGAKEPYQIGPWAQYKRALRRGEAEPDADPIRKARSAAWLVATHEPGATTERAIAAANAAELEVRKRLGIKPDMDTSQLATDGPDIYPSDARSVKHFPRELRDQPRKKRS